MQVFNRFYYSFSPQVAAVVASNPLLAAMVRILIAPLIQTLKIFMLFPGSEPWIVLAGTAVAATVGPVYLSIPVAMIAFARRGETAEKKRLSTLLESQRVEHFSDVALVHFDLRIEHYAGNGVSAIFDI